jgi:hypothetical protein
MHISILSKLFCEFCYKNLRGYNAWFAALQGIRNQAVVLWVLYKFVPISNIPTFSPKGCRNSICDEQILEHSEEFHTQYPILQWKSERNIDFSYPVLKLQLTLNVGFKIIRKELVRNVPIRTFAKSLLCF